MKQDLIDEALEKKVKQILEKDSFTEQEIKLIKLYKKSQNPQTKLTINELIKGYKKITNIINKNLGE